MFLGYDHTIFYVPDPTSLDDTCGTFEAAGFLITDREDEDRDTAATRQRLVCFADSSYIEILTVRDAEARARHRLARHMDGKAGWADFTLVTDRLGEVIARQSAAGLPVNGPLTHERRLVDGRPWKVSLGLPGVGVGHVALPFVLEDVTGRDLRIPQGRTEHPNGVSGTLGVVMSTPATAVAADHYRPIFGEPSRMGDALRYAFAPGRWIDLVKGSGGIKAVVLSAPEDREASAEMRALGLTTLTRPA